MKNVDVGFAVGLVIGIFVGTFIALGIIAYLVLSKTGRL